MTFYSILFERPEDDIREATVPMPAFFTDLNLDQIVEGITLGRQEYDLKPFFYSPLGDRDAIEYRQQVMQDLEERNLLENIRAFAWKMHTMRQRLTQAGKLYYKYEKERWFLNAVEIYCEAVLTLLHDLSIADLRSRGFLAFREYLTGYVCSTPFTSLLAETNQVTAALSAVRYCLVINGNTVRVRKYESESDYSAEVEKTFAKFQQGAVKDYRAKSSTESGMNHVEAQVLDFVAQLHPDTFAGLDSFCANHGDYLDETIRIFDREIEFYVAHLEYLAGFKREGLPFCYPCVSNQTKEIYSHDGFDLALARKLVRESASIICNDFYLKDPERILVVSGPNQGGKTTFARTFGQLHYLASLGCPVPGRAAQLFLFDQLYTHFEKEETLNNLRGKLEDDLARIHEILDRATPNSIIILNEIFTSTTLNDALFLSKTILEQILQRDLLCVCVTFLDELASLSEKTVSMVSTVVPENPTLRTFKIVRRPADGLAYALSIAEKYRLTYGDLKERLES